MQRGGLTATNRKTAMTALGIKPKSKEFDPSRFGDKASVGTTRKKYSEGGPTLGPVYSGPTGGRGGAGTYEPPVTKKTPTTRKKSYKTGGMVNPNATVKKQTVPGSKGVMSGENPKASASKVAKGRSGGISKAPKTATPKAMYGMSMKPGMMKKGGAKKK